MMTVLPDDLQNGRCLWCPDTDLWIANELWYRIQGLDSVDREPPTLQSWLARMHPEDGVSLQTSLAALHRGRRSHDALDLRIKHVEGHWIWVELRMRVDQNSRYRRLGVHGVMRDITTSKRHEATLREDQLFLGQTEQGLGIGSWQVDLADQVVSWSDETCRIHCRPPGYHPGFHETINYFTPSARPVIRACLERAQTGGEPFDIELPLNRADGRRITVRCIGSVDYRDGRAMRISGAVQDVTDTAERLLEQISHRHDELERVNERLSIATSNGGIGIWDLDLATGQFVWDEHMFRFYGLYETTDRIVSARQWIDFVHRDDRSTLRAAFGEARQGDEPNSMHFRIITADGEERRMHGTSRVIRDAMGHAVRLVGTNQDVTEQHRIASELTWRATHDELTSLVNRSEFESILQRLHDALRGTEVEHTLLFIDLDQFKIVNDSCGHRAGDLLLRKVSRLLEHAVRSDDTVARLGGDEFAVILKRCSGDGARLLAQQICDLMDEFRFTHLTHRFRIGASIGLVSFDGRWSDVSMIIRAADTACYAAKDTGRNQVHVWSETGEVTALRRIQTTWATRLATALDGDGFELYAQRIVSADSVRPHGRPDSGQAEILLRLKDEPGEPILPGAFLRAAERFNLINRIDRWVLDRVITWLQRHTDEATVGTLWVNLSGQSIEDLRFQRETLARLQEAGRALCESLCFEITETAAVTSLGDAASFIQHLRALGVRVALDDFGAGASSFGYLKNLPVNYLKIDGQFVRNLTDDPLNDAAVRCFTDVARIMGIRSVAEFVETPAVLDRLGAIGVDYVQGWLLHKPVPLDQLLTETRFETADSATVG